MRNIFENPKFKNPIFWTSLIAIIFASAGVDFNTLTSWRLFGQAILSILGNPVALVAVIVSIIGVFNDNSTRGVDKLVERRRRGE